MGSKDREKDKKPEGEEHKAYRAIYYRSIPRRQAFWISNAKGADIWKKRVGVPTRCS